MENDYFSGNGNNIQKFPRQITAKEKQLLFSILPENKPGYKVYREKIEKLLVIGFGRFGGGNLILGRENDEPDNGVSSTPILATGIIKLADEAFNISINEESDNKIEIDISVELINQNNQIGISSINYSEWIPGEKAPGDKSFVREVVFLPRKFLIVIAPAHKKIWAHEFESGINYIIPVSNFYSTLILVKRIRDPKIALQPNSLFSRLDEFSDEDIISAFVLYNKNFRRINFDYSYFQSKQVPKKKKSIFNFFKRGS